MAPTNSRRVTFCWTDGRSGHTAALDQPADRCCRTGRDLRFPVTVLSCLGGRYAWAQYQRVGWESSRDIQIAEGVLLKLNWRSLEPAPERTLWRERQRAVLARAAGD